MSIGYYYNLLQEKKAQLARLQSCNGKLQGTQQEFAHYKNTVLQPELSASTWQGNLANQFEDIRNSGMLSSYQDIQSNQFNQVFSSLHSKIQQINNEISSIQHTITYLEAQEREKNLK
ncbi:YwqH-like family protein [Cytobacillus horneckiae]|uniref:YwqH-like family protein n=1 Tax=Cytobacillus horneckiae TaxID=549687 RepID=UPI00203E7EA8|nr:DUF5082 family protein [Cytobacillus horneckiae]MCM3180968.1 DUF5082 domain-containing protein [Cytobacillus horneckiae]